MDDGNWFSHLLITHFTFWWKFNRRTYFRNSFRGIGRGRDGKRKWIERGAQLCGGGCDRERRGRSAVADPAAARPAERGTCVFVRCVLRNTPLNVHTRVARTHSLLNWINIQLFLERRRRARTKNWPRPWSMLTEPPTPKTRCSIWSASCRSAPRIGRTLKTNCSWPKRE